MNTERANFYLKSIAIYRDNQLPEDQIESLFNLIFVELSMTSPDELSIQHVCLMEDSEKHFAEQEDYKRANFMKESRESAFQIFEGRQKVLDTLDKKKGG